MARPRNPQRTDELLEAAVEVAQRRGVSALTLRPLAAELGVSPRTLLYHFGSREGVLLAIVNAMRGRHGRLAAALHHEGGTGARSTEGRDAEGKSGAGETSGIAEPDEHTDHGADEWATSPFPPQDSSAELLASAIRALWDEAKRPELRSFFSLYFELSTLAIRDPEQYRQPFAAIEDGWLDLMRSRLAAAGIDENRAELVAHVVLTGYRGALQFALATGRVEEADRVVEQLVATATDLAAATPTGLATVE